MFATPASTRTTLYWTIVVYTGLGLLSGIVYREVTKAAHFTGDTQLAVLHTHLLVLGMLVNLVILCLEKLFTLSAHDLFAAFFWLYQAGVVWTVAGMAVIGGLQVAHSPLADGKQIATLAGMGHIVLTAGLVLFLVVLKASLREPATEPVTEPGTE